jgi:hypothetical protein
MWRITIDRPSNPPYSRQQPHTLVPARPCGKSDCPTS